MSITLPVVGQVNWDIPLNLALARLGASIWQPDDYGMIAYTSAMEGLATNVQPASGGVRMRRIRLIQDATITNLHTIVTIAGITLTAGQSFLGLYNTSGTRVAVSADQSVPWTTTGFKTAALISPYAAAAGDYFVAVVTNGATTPALAVESALASFTANAGLSAGSSAFAMSGPAAQTSLPATINMATEVALISQTYWFGAS